MVDAGLHPQVPGAVQVHRRSVRQLFLGPGQRISRMFPVWPGHDQTKSSAMSQFASASLFYTSAHWYFTSISSLLPTRFLPSSFCFWVFFPPHPSLLRGQFAMVSGWTVFVISHPSWRLISEFFRYCMSLPTFVFFSSYVPPPPSS